MPYPSGDPANQVTTQRLEAVFPGLAVDLSQYRGDLSLRLPRERAIEALLLLRDDPATRYDFLMDLCGVDWLGREPRFDVVYHLYSSRHGFRLRVKIGVPEEDPWLATATTVWKAADWFERECWDLLGIGFRGHPDLRRLLCHDEFQGHALRKDYDQRQRWRCSRVSDLEAPPAEPPSGGTR